MKRTVLLCIVAVFLLLLLLSLPLLLFVLSLRGMSVDTVVMTLESPDGTYVAHVIDNDQGALGGATIVKVQKTKGFKKSRRIYIGEWGEHRTMDIYWKDDRCLVINGVEYPIK